MNDLLVSHSFYIFYICIWIYLQEKVKKKYSRILNAHWILINYKSNECFKKSFCNVVYTFGKFDKCLEFSLKLFCSKKGFNFLHYYCSTYRTEFQLVGTFLAGCQVTTWTKRYHNPISITNFTKQLLSNSVSVVIHLLHFITKKFTIWGQLQMLFGHIFMKLQCHFKSTTKTCHSVSWTWIKRCVINHKCKSIRV